MKMKFFLKRHDKSELVIVKEVLTFIFVWCLQKLTLKNIQVWSLILTYLFCHSHVGFINESSGIAFNWCNLFPYILHCFYYQYKSYVKFISISVIFFFIFLTLFFITYYAFYATFSLRKNKIKWLIHTFKIFFFKHYIYKIASTN